MSRADTVIAALVLAGSWAAAGCANHSAPEGFLPDPADAPRHAFGGWIDLAVGPPVSRERIAGELIAVSEDTVWVLAADSLRTIPTATVAEGQLVGYRSRYGRVVGATFLGTLSTVANGFGLIITAPMWIISGSLAARSQSRAPIVEAPPARWAELAPWARFPQGLPPGLEPDALRPNQLRSRP